MSRIRRRAEAALVLACAPIEDGLLEAKAAHDEAPTGETAEARQQAMETVSETRAWLRAKDELSKLPGEIKELEQRLKGARKASAKDADEARENAARVAVLDGKVKSLQAKYERIQRDFGPLVQAMDELAKAGGA